ncbi:MAG: hypothetical protein WBL50_25445, partial [Candidatus Acidiferrum sp.]
MALTRLRFLSCLLTALLAFPAAAFDSPLSDTALREAYFIGQRHDDTTVAVLDKYTTHLPPPKTGPYIDAVSFFSPFAQAVLNSNQHFNGYNAQQAELDHRDQTETVKVVIDIAFTQSYGPYTAAPTGSKMPYALGLAPRPMDFWKDFQVRFFGNNKPLHPLNSSGEPKVSCGEYDCVLLGA